MITRTRRKFLDNCETTETTHDPPSCIGCSRLDHVFHPANDRVSSILRRNQASFKCVYMCVCVCVCVYLYLSPVARSLRAESTCRGGQTSDFHLVEGQTPSRHLFARALGVDRRDFDMRIVDSRNWRTEGGDRRGKLFLVSSSFFLSLCSIHRGSLWHDVMGRIRWATAGNLIEQSRFICPLRTPRPVSVSRYRCVTGV